MKAEFSLPIPTPEECLGKYSEIEKFRHLILPYCVNAAREPMSVLELASGGMCCVPWAVSMDLPRDQYAYYNSNHAPRGAIHVRGTVKTLPFDNECFFTVSASHIMEDFPSEEWPGLLREWCRVIVRGGYLIVSIPEHDRWWAYVKNGGVHNFAHSQPQPKLGDMSKMAVSLGLAVISEKFTDCYPGDFTILGVFQKP